MRLHGQQGAMLSAVYAGVAFGLFWIPLRALEAAGLPGALASAVFTVMPVLLVLPIYLLRRGEIRMRNWRGLLGGALAGIACGFYALALPYTEIVRAVLLFYLTPIWGFLLGRLVLGEAITPVRWMAVLIGLTGIAVIFGAGESGLPLPRNAGDWIALASGLTWAVASLFILIDDRVSVAMHGANFFVFSALVNGLAVIVTTGTGQLGVPDMAVFTDALLWMIAVTLILTLPAGFATIYGPTQLAPGIVGLLFMAEVAVAAISAAVLSDEPFGMRETLGVLLILCAGLIVPLREARLRQAPGG